MANYQIVISNFHSNETEVWHTFSAQTDEIAQKRFDEHMKKIDMPFGRGLLLSDQATLSRLIVTKYIHE